MNHDENNPDLQTFIAPELEARLVAAVLGEASAFEAAELERLAAEKPELAIFKRRIEAVHGLIGLAVRPEQAPLRLAPERRAKILQTIGAAPARVPSGDTNVPVLLTLAEVRRKRRKKWIWASSMAASVAFAGFLAVNSFQLKRAERPMPDMTLLGPTPDGAGLESEVRQERTYDILNAPVQFGGQEAQAPAEDGIRMESFSVKSKPSLAAKVRKALTAPASPRPDENTAQEVRMPATESSAMVFYDGAGAKAGADKRAFAGSSALPQNQAPAAARSRTLESGSNPISAAREGLPSISLQKAPPQTKTVVSADAFGAVSEGNVGDFQKFTPGTAEKKEAGWAGEQTIRGMQEPDALAASSARSQFKVEAFKDQGYFAETTVSGARVATSDESLQLSPFEIGSRSRSTQRRVARTETADSETRDINDSFLFDAKAKEDAGSTRSNTAQSAAEIDADLSKQKAAEMPVPPPADAPRGEISAAKEAVSTFSLHVSDVSFRLAQAALARGETPDPSRIRPEEFYNAFDYGDPSPTAAEKISSRIEQAAHPLLQQRNLVRIAVKVGATGRGASQPLHLTVLLDTSGSMEREDRIASVRRALDVLASLLTANDRVTLIGFSRQPRLLAEQLPGNQATQLASLAENTPYTGGTNLEEALKLASQLARRHQNAAAQNRIVLITDGAANLGNADPAQLATMIETLRQQGIAFDACGVGTDGLDDSVLEALTRKGDGRYYVLDSAADADAGFARQLAGAFRPAAENVKVQVRFNPARVGSYRLIGFEQHRLREEDFRNDKVDAAELAAEEAAVALYQVEVLPQGEGELGEVFIRFRDAAANAMVERSWTIRHEPQARAFDRSTPSMQLAGTAALLAEKLRGGEAAGLIELAELAPVVNSLRGHYANDARVRELIAMFEQMRRRSGR